MGVMTYLHAVRKNGQRICDQLIVPCCWLIPSRQTEFSQGKPLLSKYLV